MATDGPTPLPCDSTIFREGTAVFVTHRIPSNAMEGWVKKVAAKSGQPVDWHFMDGRAVVRATGNLKMVVESILYYMDEHDRLFKEAIGPEFSDLPSPGRFL